MIMGRRAQWRLSLNSLPRPRGTRVCIAEELCIAGALTYRAYRTQKVSPAMQSPPAMQRQPLVAVRERQVRRECLPAGTVLRDSLCPVGIAGPEARPVRLRADRGSYLSGDAAGDEIPDLLGCHRAQGAVSGSAVGTGSAVGSGK